MDRTYIYEPIASVEFQGTVRLSGESFGHYICYIKDKLNGQWFLTNDNDEPMMINESEISKLSYVTLLSRID